MNKIRKRISGNHCKGGSFFLKQTAYHTTDKRPEANVPFRDGASRADGTPGGNTMKKLMILFLAAILALSSGSALADPVEINGLDPRDIKIHYADLNPSADEMIAQGISPTTGRMLSRISCPEGFANIAATKKYQPVMVQISNANNGVGPSYSIAPVNGSYADVVYEACQRQGGAETRMSMVFSDTIPDYVGFVRSTRLTHVRLRQEWDCVFCTSGYPSTDVPQEWMKLYGKNPTSKNRNAKDPGIVYVGDVGINKPWKKYVRRLKKGNKDANTELFELTAILENVVPKDYTPANHTWKFTDELPSVGDKADFIYVTFGDRHDTDSRLEYDEEDNVYIRYVTMPSGEDLPYRESTLIGAEDVNDKKNGKLTQWTVAEERVLGNTITFSNVIVQGIKMNWKGGARPDPVLTGTGNADYFMGGRHIAGVWHRTDYDSRTVFYGPDGEEIELQRGRTLIILMGYNSKSAKVSYE